MDWLIDRTSMLTAGVTPKYKTPTNHCEVVIVIDWWSLGRVLLYKSAVHITRTAQGNLLSFYFSPSLGLNTMEKATIVLNVQRKKQRGKKSYKLLLVKYKLG